MQSRNELINALRSLLVLDNELSEAVFADVVSYVDEGITAAREAGETFGEAREKLRAELAGWTPPKS